jgi:hypothetical protein
LSHGDSTDRFLRNSRFLEGSIHYWHDVFEMVPRSQFWNDSSIFPVYGHLGANDVGQNELAVAQHGSCSFIARRFDSQN